MSSPSQAPSSSRDLRLDFFRGLALWWIFLNHIPDNIFSWATVRNYGFSDATEIFVFISGYAAALAYRRPMLQQGMVFTTLHVWRRCWQLYVAHLILFLFFTAQIAYVAERFGNPMYMEEMNVTPLLDTPHLALLDALMLTFRPVNMDVLPMYIVLLLAFPAMLWMLLRVPVIASLLSIGLYMVARVFEINLPAHPPGNSWIFNPFAWQLLFVLGALLALYPKLRNYPVRLTPVIDLLALAYALGAGFIVATWHLPQLERWVPENLAIWMYPIDKTNLDTLRLVHFLALAHLTLRLVPREAGWLQRTWVWPVMLCGRKSLEVFCLGIFLSFVGHLVLIELGNDVWLQCAVSGTGIGIMASLAYVLHWYGSRAAAGRRSG